MHSWLVRKCSVDSQKWMHLVLLFFNPDDISCSRQHFNCTPATWPAGSASTLGPLFPMLAISVFSPRRNEWLCMSAKAGFVSKAVVRWLSKGVSGSVCIHKEEDGCVSCFRGVLHVGLWMSGRLFAPSSAGAICPWPWPLCQGTREMFCSVCGHRRCHLTQCLVLLHRTQRLELFDSLCQRGMALLKH